MQLGEGVFRVGSKTSGEGYKTKFGTCKSFRKKNVFRGVAMFLINTGIM